jgi:hypothetical protein
MCHHLTPFVFVSLAFISCGELASASQEDAAYAVDLQAANQDPRYARITDPTERVHVYRLHKNSELFRQCDKKFIGVLECSISEISTIEAQRAAATVPVKSAVLPPTKAKTNGASAGTTSPSNNVPTANSSHISPFLRQNMPDISLFSQMKSPKDATGAQISYSSDKIAVNDSWAINGIAGFAYQLYGNYSMNSAPYILGAYIAPYVSVDRLWNSNQAQAAKNSDTVTPGIKLEVGVDNLWGGEQYFRMGGADVFDEIANTNAVSTMFEWIPVYGKFIHYPGTIGGVVLYRFDPELIVQYDSTTDRTKVLLFSGGSNALRIGPQVSLLLKPVAKDIPIISSLLLNTTYHWADEAYSRRSLSWFQTALTYNIDPNGYFGFTGNYKRGSDENTGKKVNIYLVSLSGKF